MIATGRRYGDEPREDDCKFNAGVECKNHDNCNKCGWNPSCEIRRKAKMMGVPVDEYERSVKSDATES